MSQKYLLFVALALVFYTASSQDVELCSQYNCLNFSKDWPAASSIEWDYCAMANKFVRTNSTTTARWREYAMKSCNTSADGMTMYTCPITSISSSAQYTLCKNNTQAVQPTAKLLPGNNCTAAYQCLSNQCEAGKCKGATSSGFFNPCSADSTCDVGYSCQASRCLPLKQLGEACTLANECVPYAVCATGICRKYFSVDVGEEVGSVTDDKRACISVEYSPNDKVCEIETTRAQIGPIGQKAQTDVCRYKDNSGGLDGKKKNSVCGYGPTPSAFCPIGHGEKEFKDVRDLAVNLVNTMPTMCHISEALSCADLVQMYPRETYAFSMIGNFDNIYTMMENNDECVKYNLNYKNWWLLTGQYPKPE